MRERVTERQRDRETKRDRETDRDRDRDRVMATELISSPVRFCFLQRNYSYETKISIRFIDICSESYSAYFLVSIQISFHVV